MKPTYPWAVLVDEARGGAVARLVHALQDLTAWHRAYKWPMEAQDYPPEVLQFFFDEAAATGRPGRKPRSGFQRAQDRAVYEQFRGIVGAFKKGGAKLALKDKRGKVFEPDPWRDNGRPATPADVAMEFLAHQDNVSPNTMRDRIRKMKTTTKPD